MTSEQCEARACVPYHGNVILAQCRFKADHGNTPHEAEVDFTRFKWLSPWIGQRLSTEEGLHAHAKHDRVHTHPVSEEEASDIRAELLHPEFGSEWREPDGVIHKALKAQQAEWLRWLVDSGYGFDWRGDTDPPCTLRELAEAYHAQEPESVEAWMGSIEAETGSWPRQKDHRPPSTADLDARDTRRP